MQSLADAVRVTVERMMAKPDASLTSISIVSDEETKRIIKMGTGKEIDVDLSKTFANLFTEQAQRTPDKPAVVDRDSQLTYSELDRYSNALAHQLIGSTVSRSSHSPYWPSTRPGRPIHRWTSNIPTSV